MVEITTLSVLAIAWKLEHGVEKHTENGRTIENHFEQRRQTLTKGLHVRLGVAKLPTKQCETVGTEHK